MCSHGQTQWVFAAGLGGPDQSQDLPEGQTGHFPQHKDARDLWNAICYCPSLVEHHGLDLMEQETNRVLFLTKLMQHANCDILSLNDHFAQNIFMP